VRRELVSNVRRDVQQIFRLVRAPNAGI